MLDIFLDILIYIHTTYYCFTCYIFSFFFYTVILISGFFDDWVIATLMFLGQSIHIYQPLRSGSIWHKVNF